ncbi:MAG: hypothetical protein HQK83_07105 [Fibrobacteria bacterium]|nr:hypothetical protein [Fibrobacteria bacterium]
MSNPVHNPPWKIIIGLKGLYVLVTNIRIHTKGKNHSYHGQINKYSSYQKLLECLPSDGKPIFIFSDIPGPQIPGGIDGLMAARMCSILVKKHGKLKNYQSVFTRRVIQSKEELSKVSISLIKTSNKCHKILSAHSDIKNVLIHQETPIQQIYDEYSDPTVVFDEVKLHAWENKVKQVKKQILEYIKKEHNHDLKELDYPQMKGDLSEINELYDMGMTCAGVYQEFELRNIVSKPTNKYFNAYAYSILKQNQQSSSLCRMLLWLYQKYSLLISNIKKIKDNNLILCSRFYNYSTVTGRINDYPNALQGLSKEARHCIRVRPGYVLLDFDVKSCEPTATAGIAGGEMAVLIQQGDVYELTGEKILNRIDIPGISTRELGKAVLPVYLNGGGAYTFREELGCSKENAAKIENILQKMFIKTLARVNELAVQATTDDIVRWEFGGLKICQRLPIYPRWISPSKIERTKRSILVQGTSSLMLKRIVMDLPALLERYGIRWVLSVHDSILLEIPEASAPEAVAAVKNMMDETIREFVGFDSDFIGCKIEDDWTKERPIGPD